MIELRDTLIEIISSCYRPREKIKVWEWIEGNCELTTESGAKYKGPIDTGRTAYTRGIYEAYADHSVRFLTLAKSAQVGGTLVLKNLVLWDIASNPSPGLYATANVNMAKRFNDRELEPHFTHCKTVDLLAVRKREKWSKLEKLFKNGATLGLIGSNSPSNLGSRSVENIKMDEVDKWPPESNREAPADQLAEARTKSYEDIRKVFTISTPTIENGAIWQRYLSGTQEKYYVPCPHCGFKQELHFFYKEGEKNGGVWWPNDCRREDGSYDLDRVERETRYRCARCDGAIHNDQKHAINLAGEWVKTNPNAPSSHRSFHISALYSPFETWGGVARVYLQSKGSAGRLHDFWNNYLGLPWVRQATIVKHSAIREIVEISPDYRRGELPIKPIAISMTVDVQQENFWWVIRAWERTGVSYLIDYGAAISYEDLGEIVSTKYEFDGQVYGIYKALIDSGYAASHRKGVYDWCLASCGKFVPTKGASKRQGLRSSFRISAVEHKRDRNREILNLYTYDDDIFKEELYRNRIKERSGKAWYLPIDITNEYIEQLTAERLVERNLPRGGIEFVWETSRNNHLGDCEKMQLVFWDVVAPYAGLNEPEDEQDERAEPQLIVDIPPSEWS